MLDPLASSNHQENASKDMLTGQSDGNNSTVEVFSSHKTTCQADKVNYDSYHILILSRHYWEMKTKLQTTKTLVYQTLFASIVCVCVCVCL